MITQLVCYHLPKTPERLRELSITLGWNLICKPLSKIYVFIEDEGLLTCNWPIAIRFREQLADDKVTIVKVLKRQTYSELIDFANAHIQGLAVISNADVYYDNTLIYLGKVDFSDTVVCLSKIELLDDTGYKQFKLNNEMKGYSQDSWFFGSPVRKLLGADFFMGLQRCDNRIAYEFAKRGYKLLNPCNQVFSYHLHVCNQRTWKPNVDVVPGPVCFVPPPYDIREHGIQSLEDRDIVW